MFGTVKKQCELRSKMKMRLNNFLYIFNLRQGTILIAVHQLTLSAFALIILLVAVSHVGEMVRILNEDMTDDSEYYMISNEAPYLNIDIININNRKRFIKAQHLASVTVILLYTSTTLTLLYLLCCISLLHGAVKSKKNYVVPWILAACVAIVLMVTAIVVCDDFPTIIDLFGGHNLYHVTGALSVIAFSYAICAVSSFAVELSGPALCRRNTRSTIDERGERLMLLDHAANSSLLSAAQLSKLSQGTKSQFV